MELARTFVINSGKSPIVLNKEIAGFVANRINAAVVHEAPALLEKGILSKCEYGVKILGNGEITKKLTVQASAFSASAKEKIEAAGGKVEVV